MGFDTARGGAVTDGVRKVGRGRVGEAGEGASDKKRGEKEQKSLEGERERASEEAGAAAAKVPFDYDQHCPHLHTHSSAS